MISLNVNPGETPSNQFISFIEGSASTAPDPSSYPLHVLGADHNLNHIQGGDPTDGFLPWVTDILVYPSSEYWEGLLDSNRVRPYIDFSISDYNTLRIPSAIHNYDLYADTGKFYEDLSVDGTLSIGSIELGGNNLTLPGDLSVGGDADIAGTLSADRVQGESNTTAPILQVTTDVTFDNNNTGYIYQCKPSGSNVTITLPQTSTTGITFMVNDFTVNENPTEEKIVNTDRPILFKLPSGNEQGSHWVVIS